MTSLLVHLLLWAFPLSNAKGRLREFQLIKDNFTRVAAVNACRTNYTDLATVYDQQDNIELKTLLINITDGSSPSGWIGAEIGNGNKKWSNGDEVTYGRNFTSYTNSRCYSMKADGNWEIVICTLTRHFMCYKQDVGRAIYKLIFQTKTWFEAQLYCRENYTDLVSISNEEENEQVQNEGKESKNPFWIGLLEDSVEWSDGGQSAYRNYGEELSGDYIFLNQDGNWNKSEGGNNRYSLCYRETNNAGCFTFLSKQLPESWSKSNLNTCGALCYKSFIHVSSYKMSWEKALDYCNSKNYGLLRIESEDDQIETEREIKRQNISEPVWVGLRQSRLFGFWIWYNGLSLGNWTNWKGGSRPEHQVSEHCGALKKVKGQYKWCDKDCRSEFITLCELK